MFDFPLYKNECIIFKPVKTNNKGTKVEKKKKSGDELFGLIYIYMKVPQANSLCS
jgi:hypothetical protein